MSRRGFGRCVDCDREFQTARAGDDQCQPCHELEDRQFAMTEGVDLPFLTPRSERQERLSVSGDFDE